MLEIKNNQLVLDEEASYNFHRILTEPDKTSLDLRNKFLDEIMNENNYYEDDKGVHVLIKNVEKYHSQQTFSKLSTVLSIKSFIDEFIDYCYSEPKVVLKAKSSVKMDMNNSLNNLDDTINAAA